MCSQHNFLARRASPSSATQFGRCVGPPAAMWQRARQHAQRLPCGPSKTAPGRCYTQAHVRSHCLLPRKHTKAYRAQADQRVTAEAQVWICALLQLSLSRRFLCT